MLNTNILSDLVRNPQGRVADHIAEVGETAICTSIIVAAELRFGAAKRASARRTRQVERVLAVIDVLPFETPADAAYAQLRTQLETAGSPIGGNGMMIAAHALATGCTVETDNERELEGVGGLRIENWLRRADGAPTTPPSTTTPRT
jgi:tRNA(fMet)-specific endonuclease VapC